MTDELTDEFGELRDRLRSGEDVFSRRLELVRTAHDRTRAVVSFENDRTVADAAALDRPFAQTGPGRPLRGPLVDGQGMVRRQGLGTGAEVLAALTNCDRYTHRYLAATEHVDVVVIAATRGSAPSHRDVLGGTFVQLLPGGPARGAGHSCAGQHRPGRAPDRRPAWRAPVAGARFAWPGCVAGRG